MLSSDSWLAMNMRQTPAPPEKARFLEAWIHRLSNGVPGRAVGPASIDDFQLGPRIAVTVDAPRDEAGRTEQQPGRLDLGSLRDHLFHLNKDGIILAIKDAWAAFDESATSLASPFCGMVGRSYRELWTAANVGDDAKAQLATDGILAVLLRGEATYCQELRCTSSAGQRWLLMRVMPLNE